MRSPKFSTDNANYYIVYSHHGDTSITDLPVIGNVVRRIVGKKKVKSWLDKKNKKVYPTFEEIFAKKRIKDLDGIVLENCNATEGSYKLDDTSQYKTIIENVVETRSKVPLYFLDVDVASDDKKTYSFVATFGVMFFVTAAAMFTGGIVKRHIENRSHRHEILDEIERYRAEQEELKKEYLELKEQEASDGWIQRLDAKMKLRDLEKRIEIAKSKHIAELNKYSFSEKKFKKMLKRKEFTRRDFLKYMGVGTVYTLASLYFLGGHLMWPNLLAYDRGESSKVAPYVIHQQTELFPTTTINLRNAIWARKIEEAIAPRLRKKLGRKPTIAIVTGVMHAGLEWYLKDKGKRDRQLKRYEHELFKEYAENAKDLNGIREIRLYYVLVDENKQKYVYWNSEFLPNKGLIL